MATDINKPPKRNRSNKGEPPKRESPKSLNLSKAPAAERVAMNFYVDPEFKREYKLFAAEHDLKLIDILRESFQLYKEQYS